jgi:hypothetical protein
MLLLAGAGAGYSGMVQGDICSPRTVQAWPGRQTLLTARCGQRCIAWCWCAGGCAGWLSGGGTGTDCPPPAPLQPKRNGESSKLFRAHEEAQHVRAELARLQAALEASNRHNVDVAGQRDDALDEVFRLKVGRGAHCEACGCSSS